MPSVDRKDGRRINDSRATVATYARDPRAAAAHRVARTKAAMRGSGIPEIGEFVLSAVHGTNQDKCRYKSVIPPRDAPGLCKNLPPKEGVGNAGCQRTRSRACSVVNTRVSHHEYAETPGIPARNSFNGFLRDLPGDRAFLSPSSLRSLLLKNLTPASRRQDHTTSPSASSALVFGAISVHRIPPRVRDDHDTPLSRGGTTDDMK